MEHSERLRRAVSAIQTLKAEVAALKEKEQEPIAIVGMGCRFPGADSPSAFWQLLEAETDAIRTVPSDRWDMDALFDADPQAAGKMMSRYGGFLSDVDQFDPQFFRISPREAINMDPQQRLLLEVCWEALEDAAQSADKLAGSQTGVFLGIASSDYSEILLDQGAEEINAFVGVGNAHSVAVGRLSFFLGLQGPSLAIDTACSSSLVATHLAVQSLRTGECEMALAGGVNLILTPTVSINHSRAQMLAVDGRCKTFDEAADGFSRAEGCGVIVLKRLSDAVENGDDVLAVIKGSAVNHDGRTTGITVPNGPSQQMVIRQALQNGRVTADEIGYVEAHGTGTSLGDPIELGALAAVFSGRDQPLPIGSVKTNIGHAEAAAGMAGLMKVVLALKHQKIPSHLHCAQPTPRVDWAGSAACLRVATESVGWPFSHEQRRFAGVSSFGFGGTNAHLIIGEYVSDSLVREPVADRPTGHILPLSAKSEAALQALVERYQHVLTTTDSFADVCFTAAIGRSHFQNRLAIVAESAADCHAQLAALEFVSNEKNDRPKIAFLMTGQGSQSIGMGQELYRREPVFRAAIDRCAEILEPILDHPLIELLYGSSTSFIHRTQVTQPVLFAIEYALAQQWLAWGVVPDLLMGHSVGEIAAACVAGVFSLEDGLRLVAARGRLMGDLPANGKMQAVIASEDQIRALLSDRFAGVEIAAINGPKSVVVSGTTAGIERLVQMLESQGIRSVPLEVSHAFHSHLIDPMLAEFREVAQTVLYHRPEIDLVSNVTGRLAGAEVQTAEYWVAHAREAVRFADGMEVLRKAGVTVLLEVGPKPVLLGLGRRCWPHKNDGWLASLRPGVADSQQMRLALAELYAQGVNVHWDRVLGAESHRRLRLPTYPFQRQRYWVDAVSKPANAIVCKKEPSLGLGGLAYYGVNWQLQPRQVGRDEPTPLPAPKAIRQAVEPWFAKAAGSDPLAEYGTRLQCLDRLAADYVAVALNDLIGPGTALSIDALRSKTAELHHKRLPRLLAMMEKSRGKLPVENSALDGAEFNLLRRCGERLAGVLRGEVDPLQLIFPGGDMTEATAVYGESAGAQLMNGAMEQALQAALAQWPVGRPLRILEVGGGTGGATGYILPHLPVTVSNYVFTDISEALLARAQKKFADVDFIDYRPLNVEFSPAEQGFVEEKFDIVIAFNVLHATQDLGQSVAHVHDLLAPGGTLFLLENTVSMDWVEIIWGLTEDWWRFADSDLRSDQPLLDIDQWDRLLRKQGWAHVDWLIPAEAALAKQALLIAQVPDAESGLKESGQINGQIIEKEWLVIGDAAGIAGVVAAELKKKGVSSQIQSQTSDLEGLDSLTAVVFAPEISAHWQDGVDSSHALVALTKRLAKLETAPILWMVTTEAQAVGKTAEAFVATVIKQPPFQAMLWGLGKVIALEHPAFFGGMFDLANRSLVAAVVAEMLASVNAEIRHGEDHVAYREAGRFVARVRPIKTEPKRDLQIKQDAGYLITGGLGGLGLQIADWLVAQGARHLLLISRNGAGAAAQKRIAQLEQKGAQVHVLTADVSDQAAMAALFGRIKSEHPPLSGIVHAAGVPGDCLIADMDEATFDQALAAKVAGSWHLHQLTAGIPLDFFVLTSSMVSIWGAKRQGHYVAANHFLDMLAHYRHGLNLPALAINFGPLHGGMFREELAADLQQMGIATHSLDDAMAVLADWLLSSEPQVAAVDIDWDRFKTIYEMRGIRPMLALLGQASQDEGLANQNKNAGERVTADVGAVLPVLPIFNKAADFRDRWERIPASEQRVYLQKHIQAVVGQILRFVPPHLPDSRQGFFDLGLDSLTAMELKSELDQSLGVSLPPTLAFDFSTIAALTDHLLANVLITIEPAADKPSFLNSTDLNSTDLNSADPNNADPNNADIQVDVTADDLETMADEDVEALLMQRLAKRGSSRAN